MSPLPQVYAYRDVGSMGPRTRWKPRKMFCTSEPRHGDQPGELCVGKFCQGRQGAAAMISEIVCRHLLASVGVAVLDALIIHASETFARSWNDTPAMPFRIVPGVYFGTRYRGDAIPIGAPAPVPLNQIYDLQQIIDLWVSDTLVGNIDRTVFGNVLMVPRAKSKFIFIAADQSDCFCGSVPFSDGTWRAQLRVRPRSECIFIPDAVGLGGGARVVRESIERTRIALTRIRASFEDVPQAWWEAAQIEPNSIEQELWRRHESLPEILRLREWGDLNYEQYNIPIL